MVRECVARAARGPAPGGARWSSISRTRPIPKDASIDAPYTAGRVRLQGAERHASRRPRRSRDRHGSRRDLRERGVPRITTSTSSPSRPRRSVTVDDPASRTAPAATSISSSTTAPGTMVAQSRGFGDSETIACPGTGAAVRDARGRGLLFEVFPAVAGAVNAYTFSMTGHSVVPHPRGARTPFA